MRCVKTKHQNELAAKRGPGMRRAQNSKASKNERGRERERVRKRGAARVYFEYGTDIKVLSVPMGCQ